MMFFLKFQAADNNKTLVSPSSQKIQRARLSYTETSSLQYTFSSWQNGEVKEKSLCFPWRTLSLTTFTAEEFFSVCHTTLTGTAQTVNLINFGKVRPSQLCRARGSRSTAANRWRTVRTESGEKLSEFYAPKLPSCLPSRRSSFHVP